MSQRSSSPRKRRDRSTITSADRGPNAYRALFEACADGMLLLNDRGMILDVNTAYVRRVGLAREQIVGHDLSEPWPPVAPSTTLLWDACVSVKHTGQPYRYEETISASPQAVRIATQVLPLFAAPDRPHKRTPRLTGFIVIARDVTEHISPEERLLLSETRFRVLIETISDVVSILTASGTILYKSPSIERVLGYRPDEMVGQNVFDLVHPADVPNIGQVFNNLVRQPNLNVRVEARFRHKDGSWRHLEAVGQNLIDDPAVRGIVVSSRDITERKRMEAELRLVHITTQAISEARDFHSALAVMLQKVCEITEWDFGESWVPRPDGTVLECSPGWYASTQRLTPFRRLSQDMTFAPGEGLPGRIWISGQPEWITDVSSQPESIYIRAWSAAVFGFKAGFGVPVVSNGEVLAVLVFFMVETREEDRRLIDLISTLTTRLGTVLRQKRAEQAMREAHAELEARVLERTAELARVHENLRQQVAEWARAKSALRQSEELLRSVIDNAPVSLFLLDQAGRVTFAAGKRLETVGLTSQQAIGQHFRDYWPSQESAALFHRVLAGEPVASLVDTGVAVFDVRLSPHRAENGDILGVIGVAVDITERKRVENALRESEKHLRTLVMNAPIVLFAADRKGVFTVAEGRGLEALGLRSSEMVGRSLFDVFGNLVPQIDQLFQRALSSEDFSTTVEVLGSAYEVRCSVVRGEVGEVIGVMGAAIDVTERSQIEAELTRLAAAVESAGESIVITDHEATIQYVNPAFERITGYHREEARGKNPRILKSGKHDNAFYRGMWETLLSGRIWRGTLVNKRKDGALFDVEQTIAPVRDASGRIVHFVTVQRDITERRQAEARIEREARQRAALGQMGQVVAASLDLGVVLKKVIDEVSSLLGAEGVSILLLEKKALVFAAAGGIGADRLIGQRIPSTVGIAGEVIQTGHSAMVRSAADRERIYRDVEQMSGYHTQALLAVPLNLGNEVIGVMEAVHRQPGAFSADDLRLLEAAAAWTAIAIGNARQHERLQRRLQESEAMAAISQALNETLDLKRILNMIVHIARQIIPAVERSVIHLIDEERRVLHPAAVAGLETRGDPDFTMYPGEGIAGLVIARGTTLNIRDIWADSRYVPIGKSTDLRSLLVAPIQSGPRRLGTLSVQSTAPDAFSTDDEWLLTTLGIEAAIAIENARLFEVERRHLEEAIALQRVTQAISSRLDVGDLLETVVAALAEVAQYQYVRAYFVERERLRLMAHHGYRPEQIVEFASPDQSVFSWVLHSGRPAFVPDVPAEPSYVSLAPEVCSSIAVPITRPNEHSDSPHLIGVLIVETGAERRMDQDDLRLVIGVGQQLSVALENARLYSDLESALRQEQATRTQLVQAGKLAAMGRMVASVAHELNNPLQAIKNCLFLAQEESASDTPIREYLSLALSEVERLSNLVQQLREVYRPSLAGQMRPLTLSRIVEEVRMVMSSHLERHHVQWRYLHAPTSVLVNGNADQLKQVMLNLCLNAVDAMQPGGGTLTVSQLVTPDGKEVGVAFQDTGHGIKPEDVPNLFDPFFTTKETGMGLGLAICYDIAQKHGGRITMESQLGQGTTFTVWLPVASQEG